MTTDQALPPPPEVRKSGKPSDRFEPLRVRDVRFGGEIDRRIRAAIAEDRYAEFQAGFLKEYASADEGRNKA